MHSAIRRQTIADLLARTAQRLPHKLGLFCGAHRFTFAELNALVDRVAAGLAGREIGHGSHLAMLARYHCAQLDVFLGLAIYVGATRVVTARPTPENLLHQRAYPGGR